ncbi:PLA2G7, partial [Symbiodinium pilosum]
FLDTSTETAASLLNRPIPSTAGPEENYGKLLLSALPVAELRRMGKGLGISEQGLGKGSKSKLVSRLCEAAKQQRLLQVRQTEGSGEAQLVAQALAQGRWVCVAPTPGRRALAVLGELFRLETCGAPDSSYVVFSTRWPDFAFQPDCSAPPLFVDRASLDAFVEARSLLAGLERLQRIRPCLDRANADAQMAEEGLQSALLAVRLNDFESAKFRDPFRRRFTAAWCYAEALHHSVLHSPAVGHRIELQASKIRRLRLLLTCTLCPSQRGRWYAELAKEVARCEGLMPALEVASEGLAEGEDKPLSVRVAVDLTLDVPSSQEVPSEDTVQLLPRDARWDLARRCRTLARRQAKATAKGKAAGDWQKVLQKTQVAQLKAEGGDDGGKWLPKLVTRLIAEEDAATGQVQILSAAKIGLPQVAPPDSGKGTGQRRMFDGFHLEELTVEELAMQHYFKADGGGFQCGIHCEGSILRDLFGILMFDELFDCSVADAFVSAFQDPEGGPRSLQTEIWYPAGEEARELPRNRFSEFLGRGTIPGSIEAAESSDAIGGYRSGLTIAELDESWPNIAVRDARLRDPTQEIGSKRRSLKDGWPLVIFSHGSGAYRASYIFFTEFLASQGFIVAACDHPGSARYTQVNGRVIKPGGQRSERSQMEADRPLDVLFLLDSMAKLTDGQDSRFAGRVDVKRCALTGMSFGGWTAAAALEFNDPRVKAAILMCPSLMSAEGRLTKERTNSHTPLMVMIGTEDTVIGTEGNALGRDFAQKPEGCSYLVEVKRGGHCSFTSCDLYNPAYGNGIGESKSLSNPGSIYTPLDISKQHEIINGYGLAFLDKYLRGGNGSFLAENHYADEIVYKKS